MPDKKTPSERVKTYTPEPSKKPAPTQPAPIKPAPKKDDK